MKKLFLSFALICLSVQGYHAQNFQPYSINVCNPASSGYYFFEAIDVRPNSNIPPTQMILDSLGRTIYYKVFVNGGGDFKLQPDGRISYLTQNKFFLLDSTFTIVDTVSCQNGIQTDGHDLQILPNGHFLLMGYENVTMNLSSYIMFGGMHNVAGSPTASVKCGVVQEQDTNHNVVFEWHAKDYYSFLDVDTSWMGSPNTVDWNHFNAVELDDDGNILLSVRHFNEITKINRSDSSIIWRLGGNANQFTFSNNPTKFIGQHDIRRIANGNITLWDNGRPNFPFHAGIAKEYQLDESLLTANLVWNYVESPSSYSSAIGNMQRLDNGNSLIDYGMTPSEARLFDVVDPSGNKVFEIQFIDTLRSYRAFNYLTLPWELPRPQITCTTINNQSYLDAGSGYGSYLWSTGATTQTIPVTVADTFSVFVPIGIGGFIRSEYFIVTNINNPCSPTGVENYFAEKSFSIFPNPATEQIFIESEFGANQNVLVEIFDFTGKQVYSGMHFSTENKLTVPIHDLVTGIYFVRVNGEGQKFVKQ